jgi:choice-of-anchor C domain-containing protein
MPALRRILTSGLTAALLLPAAAAPGPAFRDGFESPPVKGQFQRLPTGSHIGPWTVTAGTVDLATTGLWQTPAGRQTLDLDGDTNGTVSTTIAVRPLTTYQVTYSLAGNPASAPMLKTGEVRANGRTVQRFTFDTSLTSLSRMAFDRRSLYVFSLGEQLRLDFVSTTTPAGYGPVLDDVRVDSCLVVLCPSTRTAARA